MSCFFGSLDVNRGYSDFSTFLDVDFRIRLADNFFDVFTSRPYNIFDLIRIDDQVDDPRSIRRDFGPRFGQGFLHFFEHIEPSNPGFSKRFFQDRDGNPGDLQIKLDGCYPFFCPGHLEVHITKMIF